MEGAIPPLLWRTLLHIPAGYADKVFAEKINCIHNDFTSPPRPGGLDDLQFGLRLNLSRVRPYSCWFGGDGDECLFPVFLHESADDFVYAKGVRFKGKTLRYLELGKRLNFAVTKHRITR